MKSYQLGQGTCTNKNVTGHFEISALNNPKMTISTVSKIHDMCVTSDLESQISLRFVLQSVIFELQANLKQVQ